MVSFEERFGHGTSSKVIEKFKMGDKIPAHAKFIHCREVAMVNLHGPEMIFFYEVPDEQAPVKAPDEG